MRTSLRAYAVAMIEKLIESKIKRLGIGQSFIMAWKYFDGERMPGPERITHSGREFLMSPLGVGLKVKRLK